MYPFECWQTVIIVIMQQLSEILCGLGLHVGYVNHSSLCILSVSRFCIIMSETLK